MSSWNIDSKSEFIGLAVQKFGEVVTRRQLEDLAVKQKLPFPRFIIDSTEYKVGRGTYNLNPKQPAPAVTEPTVVVPLLRQKKLETVIDNMIPGRDEQYVPFGFFKDMKAQLSINITGEQKNKMAVMETLSNVLQTVAGNPMALQDPNMAMIFNRIMEMSGAGVSPISLSKGGMQAQAGGAQGGQMAPGAPTPLAGDELKALQPQGTQ
jgi:hypothetical protein